MFDEDASKLLAPVYAALHEAAVRHRIDPTVNVAVAVEWVVAFATALGFDRDYILELTAASIDEAQADMAAEEAERAFAAETERLSGVPAVLVLEPASGTAH